MADIVIPEKIESGCECYESCEVVSFKEVVGSKTVEKGGLFGDLIAVVRANVEDAKTKGELTEGAAGEVMAQGIVAAMKEATNFALTHGKAQKEIAYIASQREYQLMKIRIEVEELDIKRKMNDAQIANMECKCDNETRATDSKISLNAAQESKLACDCCNSSKLMTAQAALYQRQAEGFNDNANQKLYETQMQTWAMVFEAAELPEVNPTIRNAEVCDSYHRLKSRLEGTWDSDGIYHPAPKGSCG